MIFGVYFRIFKEIVEEIWRNWFTVRKRKNLSQSETTED